MPALEFIIGDRATRDACLSRPLGSRYAVTYRSKPKKQLVAGFVFMFFLFLQGAYKTSLLGGGCQAGLPSYTSGNKICAVSGKYGTEHCVLLAKQFKVGDSEINHQSSAAISG
jgi:hypothetical protein